MKKIILVPALLGVMGIGGIIAVSGGTVVGSADTSKVLTKNEIEKIALAEVKGDITEIDFDMEGTRKVYEVEVVTADAEYDLKYDALSGKLLKKTKDDHDDERNSNTSTSKNANINANEKTKDTAKTNQQIQEDDRFDDDYDDRYDDNDDDDNDDRYDD